MSVNKVILVGRIGQDPEKRTMPNNGKSVVNISIATTEKWKDQQGNKQERVEWSRLVFYDRLADIVDSYVKKGSQVYIEGKLQTREWQDKDGVKKFTTEIICNNMQMLDSKSSQNQQSQPMPGQQQGHPPQTNSNNDDFLEDD